MPASFVGHRGEGAVKVKVIFLQICPEMANLREGKERNRSCLVVSNSETLCTITCQVPPSMGFSRQEYWSGLPFPSPGDLPNPGMETWSPALQADSLPSEPPGRPLERGYVC